MPDNICEAMVVVRDGIDDAHEEPCHANLRWFVAREIGSTEPPINTLLGCERGHPAEQARPTEEATRE